MLRYYVTQSDGDLIGPFKKKYEALTCLAHAIRLFFNKTPSPGFCISGIYPIYDKCIFGLLGPGFPPMFELKGVLALLHGFTNTADGIKVEYLLSTPPHVKWPGLVYNAPEEYINNCNPSDVKKIDRHPFLQEAWLYELS